ncbi:hypothetical protein [Micromonospora endolithica]|uniref:Uncharacterized protein n=1 Tax=Micromonospora endolithica TaxID=230091 RepID=A0A3A9ZGR8_9ACTN|nr:hypothetical protein [Micromonospora endolithica]RKN47661.1 hypothetical protein D7223_12965 [Micromonospora endolithica]TWJ21329.1 hypothetical protein JD76_01439 [Micromonospora endolithica]
MANTTSGGCYTVGELLDASKDRGQLNGTQVFGLDIAEKVIFEHYVTVTNHAAFPQAVLDERDWPDHGGKRNYCEMLARRNKHVTVERLMAERMRWPDIVTHDGVSAPPIVAIINSLVLHPGRPAAPRPALRRGRHEFYEIKPDSDTGIERGKEKLKDIIRVYRKFELPYRPGDYYPPYGKNVKIPLPVNRLFAVLCGTLLARHGMTAIRLALHVRRERSGLLLYKICVEMDSDDRRRQQTLSKALAKHILAVYVYCLAPERFRDLGQELGDTSYEGDAVPRIRCAFDVIEQLKPFNARIEEAMFQRGLALPGEQWLLVCDEAAYRQLVPLPGPSVNTLWAQFRRQAEAWAELLGGKQGVTMLRQDVLVKVEEMARLANGVVPGLREFADAVIRWMSAHPYLTVALVVVPVVVTGGLAVAIDAGLLVGGALAAAEISGGEIVGANMIGGLGRAALPQLVVEAGSGTQVAAATASRGVAMTFQEVALAQAGGAGAAANTTSNVVPLLTTAMKAAAPVVKTAAAAAGGIAVLTFSTQAYAGTPVPPAATPAPEQPQTTVTAPDPRHLIAEVTSGVYLVRALAAHRGPRDAVKGDRINVHDHGQTRADRDLFASPEPPAPLHVRYLGRVTVR